MTRVLKIFLLFIFLLISLDVYSLEIEKVTPSLQYLYNYYKDIDSTGAFRADKDSDLITYGGITIVDPLSNNVGLYFFNNIPHIRADISYSGDKKDLHSLGVRTGTYYGGYITARFQLSILPQIVSLSTVKSIYDSAKIEHENIDTSLEPRYIYNPNKPGFSGLLYEKLAEERQLCFQLSTIQLFSTTGHKVNCNSYIVGNNIYVHLGISSPGPRQVVGMVYSRANGECCIDFIDSVFYIHFIVGDTTSLEVNVSKTLLSVNVIKQGVVKLANINETPFRRLEDNVFWIEFIGKAAISVLDSLDQFISEISSFGAKYIFPIDGDYGAFKITSEKFSYINHSSQWSPAIFFRYTDDLSIILDVCKKFKNQHNNVLFRMFIRSSRGDAIKI